MGSQKFDSELSKSELEKRVQELERKQKMHNDDAVTYLTLTLTATFIPILLPVIPFTISGSVVKYCQSKRIQQKRKHCEQEMKARWKINPQVMDELPAFDFEVEKMYNANNSTTKYNHDGCDLPNYDEDDDDTLSITGRPTRRSRPSSSTDCIEDTDDDVISLYTRNSKAKKVKTGASTVKDLPP
eukprot:Pgem_evm1s17859